VPADASGVGNVAQRYAAALYDLADEKGALDIVAADLNSLQAMIDASDDFRRFIKSPVINRTEQSKGIAALAEKAQLSPIARQFLGLVSANRRLFALDQMIRGYNAILADRRGHAAAEVTAAAPLSDSQAMALKDALSKTVGRNVQVVTKVDPSILGGLIVRVGSRMVDSSIKSKLQRLKLALKGVG
jgi:F-type H+-transporting ATPase subunit delta